MHTVLQLVKMTSLNFTALQLFPLLLRRAILRTKELVFAVLVESRQHFLHEMVNIEYSVGLSLYE